MCLRAGSNPANINRFQSNTLKYMHQPYPPNNLKDASRSVFPITLAGSVTNITNKQKNNRQLVFSNYFKIRWLIMCSTRYFEENHPFLFSIICFTTYKSLFFEISNFKDERKFCLKVFSLVLHIKGNYINNPYFKCLNCQ